MNKFYDFKNLGEASEMYVYGDIVSEKQVDFWTGETSKTDVEMADFKNLLDQVPNNSNLKMYVNSAGGDVFATSAIISMLNRAKARGITIDAYIDGVACSCASWLVMVADTINIYNNSILMVHKPLMVSMGNADQLQKDIDVLNKIEDDVMLPIYEAKAKCGKKKLKDMISAETWLSSSEIAENFKVNLIDTEKKAKNCESRLFNLYLNKPKVELEQEPKEEPKKIDYSIYENIIKEIKEGK